MSSDQLWNYNNISKKEVFVAKVYKKVKIFSASLDIFVEERNRERRKRLISSQRMWQCLLGSSSFRAFSWFRDNFWEFGSSQSICISDVSKESGYMVQLAPTTCCNMTIIVLSSPSSSSWWWAYQIFEKSGCALAISDNDDGDADDADDDDDDADDDKYQAYQIFQNLKREAWF